MMRKCRFCHEDIQDAATVCPHCRRDLIPGRSTTTPPAAAVAVAPALPPAPTYARGDQYCQSCGSVGRPKTRVKGSFWIEVLLWFCFFVPGLIYSIWRPTTKEQVCPVCGTPNMIPVDSPKARAALAK